jgi:hypothetical protein
MSLVVGDVYEVRFIFQQANQMAINRRHFRIEDLIPGNPTQLEQADLANAIYQHYAPKYADLLSETATQRGASVQRVLPGAKGPVIYSSVPPTVGNIPGDPLPSQIAGLIQFRADLPGRHSLLRSYIPFPSEGRSDEKGRPSNIYLGRLGVLAEAHVSPQLLAWDNDNFIWVKSIAHPVLPGQDPDIIAARARTGWATQRRRGFFGAANVPPL